MLCGIRECACLARWILDVRSCALTVVAGYWVLRSCVGLRSMRVALRDEFCVLGHGRLMWVMRAGCRGWGHAP